MWRYNWSLGKIAKGISTEPNWNKTTVYWLQALTRVTIQKIRFLQSQIVTRLFF